MENFNFKVEDKVAHKNWDKDYYVVISAIGKEFFLAETPTGDEFKYLKKHDWQPYKEPKQKPKLHRFYCSDYGARYLVQYFEDKQEALNVWNHAYTEAEFLEKFEVEI